MASYILRIDLEGWVKRQGPKQRDCYKIIVIKAKDGGRFDQHDRHLKCHSVI